MRLTNTLSLELRKQIVKGRVADSAITIASLQELHNEELARILEEIAMELKK